MNWSNFILGYPAALALLPVALGFLVYAYRRRGIGPRTVVGSILILKKIEQRKAPRRTFHPPFRFFYELLIATIMTLACAGLAFQRTGERVAVVIDTSLSMSARGSSAETLWQAAITAATEVLGQASMFDEVELWRTAPQLIQVQSTALSPREARQILASLSPAFGPDGFDQGSSRIFQDSTIQRMIFITDRPPPRNQSDDRISIRSVATGAPRSNIAIGNASLDVGTGAVTATIRSFSDQLVNGSITVESFGDSRWTLVTQSPFTLAAAASDVVTVPLDAASSSPLRLSLQLSPESTLSNALPTDDRWWLVPNSARPIIEVESPLSLSQLRLQEIPTFQFVEATPQAATYRNPVILHRQPPRSVKAPGILIIRPQSPGARLHQNVQATRWSTNHQITSYVTIPNLRFPESISFELLSGFEALISASHGPLLAVRETARDREAVIGFELLPFEGKSSAGASILTLNLLKWLSGVTLQSGSLGLGEPFPGIAPGSSATAIDGYDGVPESDRQTAPPVAPGLYQVGTEYFAVNYFSTSESDLLSTEPAAPIIVAATSTQDQRHAGLYQWLAIACLGLLSALALFLTLPVKRESADQPVGAE